MADSINPVKNGSNIIVPEQKPRILKLLLSQFKSPLIYVLIIAALLTLLLKEYTDSIVIGAAVILNTVLGFYQEYKAENALFFLRSMLKPKVISLVDGKRVEVDAQDLKPGDIVVLTGEYKIPADGVLIESEELLVNESILTGESLPIKKSINQEIFAGTEIANGLGTMKVVSVGQSTRMGKIGQEVMTQTEDQTPLQRQISSLATKLTILIIVSIVLLAIVGLWLGYDRDEILFTSISVAVASIPEGLVVTLTVILTVGMQRILKQKALVRKLLATETLGSVTVICFDKTGTITEGRLRVVDDQFASKEIALDSAILCNNLIDPIEVTMLEWVTKERGAELVKKLQNDSQYERLGVVPFNHKNKFTATLNRYSDQNIIFAFGAPESVLELSQVSEKEKKEISQKVDELGITGNKLIGLGYKFVNKEIKTLDSEDVEELTWNGIIVFDDPVRTDVKEVIDECRSAGIDLKMITGDRMDTALFVAKKIGLINQSVGEDSKAVITGGELEKLSEEELKAIMKSVSVFARIDPFQKLKIVKALKSLDEVVAMTGDGVNDAPALKKADIGIVVNEASEVSKGTADIVLLDSNFKTIVGAVEEGRVIFENIKKVVLYLLSGGFSELVLIVGAILLGLPLPVTAAQILWLNLIEDSLPALSLAAEPKENDVMKQAPRPKNYNILDNRMKLMIVIYSLVTDLSLLLIFYYLSSRIEDLALMRTILFVGLGIGSIWYIFSCKSMNHSIFATNIFSNRYMLASVVVGMAMFLVAIYVPFFQSILGTVPLEPIHWALLMLLGAFNLFVIEVLKWVTRAVDDRRK